MSQEIIDIGKAFLDTGPGEEILKKVSGFKGSVDEFKKIKKDLIDKYDIVIQAYDIKGIVANEQTSQPLAGVKIQLFFGLYPIKKETFNKKVVTREVLFATEEDVEEGKATEVGDLLRRRNGQPKTKRKVEIVEQERWVKDDSKDKELKTNKEGEYEMKIGLPILREKESEGTKEERVIIKPQLIFTKEKFGPALKTPVELDGTIKSIQTPVTLLDIDEEARRINEDVQAQLNKISVANAIEQGLDAADKALLAVKNQILKFVNQIQTKLFPLAISLMVIFGIVKLSQANEETVKCPSNALLKLAISRRNKVVRALNQMWAVIATNVALTVVFLQLQILFKQAKVAIASLPLPLGAPLGVGIPYNIVSKLQGFEDLFTKLEGYNKEIRKALIISLVYLLASVVLIVIYLKKIDKLLEDCIEKQKASAGTASGDGDGDDDDDGLSMEEINNEILALTIDEENQGNELVKQVNGFTLSVVVDRENQVGSLYRRYAQAVNSEGVVILKGEPSFSAIDQILLDELSFYIVNNNLKAD